jgi:hypothetical protein
MAGLLHSAGGEMSFKKLPDNRGMIYEPECISTTKKQPCPDCFSCQWCGNERCRVCRGKAPEIKKKTGSDPGEQQ